MGNGKVKTLGVFALAMINVAAVLSLRNYPSMAVYGWSSIGWYILGTITFLLPLTLAGAELATGWPKGGGVYLWVKEAFGEKSGFIAIFCEWSNNLVWFPTVLAFIASTFAFAINPALENNNIYMFLVMMIAFWGTTIISNMGEKVSSRFGSFGVIAGSIIPAVFIIILGLAYTFTGKPLAIPPLHCGSLGSYNQSQHPAIHRHGGLALRRDGNGWFSCAGSTGSAERLSKSDGDLSVDHFCPHGTRHIGDRHRSSRATAQPLRRVDAGIRSVPLCIQP